MVPSQALPIAQTGVAINDAKTSLLSETWRRYFLALNDTLASGVYTPSLTLMANVAAATASPLQWLRVGTSVTVSGQIEVDPTAGATLTTLGISLPVPSALAATYQCGGTAAAPAVAGYAAAILGDAANQRATFQFTTGADVSNQPWSLTFTYQVVA